MDNSFIKLYRGMIEWEWYSDSKMVHLYIHLLLKANFSDGRFHGKEVKRGQLITGRNALSKDTGISTQSIRTCLERLKSTNEITIQSTNDFSLITIVKYDVYQYFDKQSTNKSTNQLTNDQPASNQQVTTIEEEEEEKKNNIDIRKLKFADTLKPFLDKYGKEMIRKFYDYWTEPNKSNTKFKQELQKTWDVKRRLDSWSSNNFDNKKQQHTYNHDTNGLI
jgi:hypothetical protein